MDKGTRKANGVDNGGTRSKHRSSDHVVMHDGSQGFWGFECTRCKQRQEMPQPVLVDVLIAAGKAFHKLHKGCKPR